MVSHQLVYVTGMLEVILTPSDPSGRLKTGGGAFRALGNRQNRWRKLSEASEIVKTSR